jgi:hypothetical protein
VLDRVRPAGGDPPDAADGPRARRGLVRALLRCTQTDRRAAMARLRWRGLDGFWVDVLGSNMPGPYPHTGLAAYLVPAD